MIVSIVCKKNTRIDDYGASSLTKRSMGAHCQIVSQLIFVLTSYCCMLGGGGVTTDFIDFGLNVPGFKP